MQQVIRGILPGLCVWVSCLAAARGEFTPIVGFDQQIFPSYIIATASIKRTPPSEDSGRLGDSHGTLGVQVKAADDDTPFTVTIECDTLLEKSVYTGVLPKAGTEYEVMPFVKYRYEQLARFEQATPTSITFRVKVGDAPEEEQTLTCTAHSINDCPFVVRHGEETIDISYAFAAYVNEQHPFVDKLLREALDQGKIQAFTGYQEGEAAVIRQAYALWDLLVKRDVRYSSITNTVTGSDNVGCQHVRMIEDSINNAQANCVDGSVLWVSLLRKIGIDAFLVLEPTHCYAGFYLDAAHQKAYAIETTLLGVPAELGDAQLPADIDGAVGPELRERSFDSFCMAILSGTERFTQQVQADKAEPNDATQVIDIAEARQLGILPIPFQNKEDFYWHDFSTTEDSQGESASTQEAEFTEVDYTPEDGSTTMETDSVEVESVDSEDEAEGDDSFEDEDDEEEGEEDEDEQDDEASQSDEADDEV